VNGDEPWSRAFHRATATLAIEGTTRVVRSDTG